MAEEYTVSHTGSVLGDEYVTLETNQTSPARRDPIISFECPDKFEKLEYVGDRHPIRFEPRTMESATMADDDTSGALEEAERTVSLEANLQPIAGETEIADQTYPVVEAVNVTQGAEIAPEDLTVDYHTNEVVIPEADVAAGDDVKLYPILTKGTVKWGGKNALNQDQGTLYPWGFPVFRFHDMEQIRAGREITMQGRATWGHNEELELRLESEEQIVWEDADYPGAYVSEIEVDLSITL
ncbi:hypothetical protein ACFOZ7_05615 [Natribaculum luteum]|uniref:Uncharacterized protein n=1 Tax=Natribaculum luteum TaxID=1586232 RepID=A0ABD5NXT1_9EURY|nr:hypothetical protein [Natribaculum luteum]